MISSIPFTFLFSWRLIKLVISCSNESYCSDLLSSCAHLACAYFNEGKLYFLNKAYIDLTNSGLVDLSILFLRPCHIEGKLPVFSFCNTYVLLYICITKGKHR